MRRKPGVAEGSFRTTEALVRGSVGRGEEGVTAVAVAAVTLEQRDPVRGLYLTGMTTRIGAKGQVVIPKGVRDQAQLHPGDEVEIAFDEDRIVIAARRRDGALGGRFARSGMAERLLEDRRREPR